jgi:hypothetical protein
MPLETDRSCWVTRVRFYISERWRVLQGTRDLEYLRQTCVKKEQSAARTTVRFSSRRAELLWQYSHRSIAKFVEEATMAPGRRRYARTGRCRDSGCHHANYGGGAHAGKSHVGVAQTLVAKRTCAWQLTGFTGPAGKSRTRRMLAERGVLLRSTRRAR